MGLAIVCEVKIRERAVDDEQMSTCPAACGRPLGRVIPPGVVRRAVGDDLFARLGSVFWAMRHVALQTAASVGSASPLLFD